MSQIQFLASTLLRQAGFRHAFFTRRGGVSEGPYESLNFSFAVGDKPVAVHENLGRAAATLGVSPERLHFLSQVHGSDVVTIDGRDSAESLRRREGDAVVAVPGPHACAVRVADCVPILLADPRTGVVAAVHAGWRGVVAQVIAAAVGRMGQLGARPAEVIAAVGPHISVAAFEVGEDVASKLAAAAGTESVVEGASTSKPRVNLRRIARHQLVQAGLATERVDDVEGCTFSDRSRFFSYRRDGKEGGRHLAAIVPSL